ncbi:MAG TPA: FtsX-like permease family protein [Nocardioidaceae bacterium]|nr:FtsX-like permease family protein [Nocardioidaceae bacterium]
MYPAAMVPLAVATGIALGFVCFLLVRRPVLRRLALRQIRRRPTEAILVVVGSLLGTALIVGSMVVGDSLDRSVRQSAYDVLGPIDETVRSGSLTVGYAAAERLAPLADDPRVDGLLTVRGDQSAAVHPEADQLQTEPRALVWELDFDAAGEFGGSEGSGLDVPEPGPNEVVVNDNLAESLDATVGDEISFAFYGQPQQFTVVDVVPAEGLAGMGVGAAINRNAFFPEGTLVNAAEAVGREPMTTTLVSNAGDVESGEELTDEVEAAIHQELGELADSGAVVSAPKHEVLEAARETGAILGSLFLFIASFSIIAGVLLLVNIFVMLTEERKGQLGILRAIGMRRRRVSAEFTIEGALYGAIAAVVGAGLGLLVGRVVVILAVNVLNGWNPENNQLTIVYDVRTASLVNGICAGFLIAFLAVALTSVRIARTNIIAAIRNLEPTRRRHGQRRLTILSAILTAAFVAASWPAILDASSQGAGTYLFPALAAVSAIPLLRLAFRPSTVTTAVALAVLGWGLVAHIVSPHVYDESSTTTYVVLGTMLSFAAVVLLSQHQVVLLRPLRRWIDRPSESGLALRLAVAYPTARRFRTGVTLAMYCLVVLVIVLLTQISAIIRAGVDQSVQDASAGWSVRMDYNPNTPVPKLRQALTDVGLADQVAEAAPLVTAPAYGNDPLGRTDDPVPSVAVGMPAHVRAGPALDDRLPGLSDDAAAWGLVTRDPTYVMVDAFYASPGGPPGKAIEPGDPLTLTNPRTGAATAFTIAGVMTDGTAFYGISGGEFRYPVLMGDAAVRATFGSDARLSSVLLSTRSGVDVPALTETLESLFLTNGVVATDIEQSVRNAYAANTQFFQLMQGYLALGLFVGITGLGVVMVRAVRERRRTIGVLRALGFRARTVRRAFLAESTFIAVEGIVVGTLLGIVTTWLLYQNSPAFGSIDVSYPIAWGEIGLTVGAALLASVVATAWPARRASRIKPALAVRVAD